MKNKLFTLLVIASLISPFTTHAAVLSSTSLLTDPQIKGYYKLDEASGNAADSSAYGATLTNNNSTPFIAGHYSNSATTTASLSRDFSNISTAFGAGSSTIVGWVTFSKLPASGGYAIMAASNTAAPTYINGVVGITNASGVVKIVGGRSKSGVASDYIYYTTSPATDGTWYHLGLTYDAATTILRMYFNGSEVASTTTSGNGAAGSENSTRVGSYLNAYGYWDGQIDDVAFFSRALSSSEISTLATDATPSTTATPKMQVIYFQDE